MKSKKKKKKKAKQAKEQGEGCSMGIVEREGRKDDRVERNYSLWFGVN